MVTFWLLYLAMILDLVDLGIMKDMKLCYKKESVALCNKISDSVAGGEWRCMVGGAQNENYLSIVNKRNYW